MTGQAQPFADRNKPLRRVILVPFDRIAIIHRELMVEVVVPFTNRHKSRNKVIARCMLIVERRFTKPVGK
jgi:hypothetical protein